jgi:hypothetical protein
MLRRTDEGTPRPEFSAWEGLRARTRTGTRFCPYVDGAGAGQGRCLIHHGTTVENVRHRSSWDVSRIRHRGVKFQGVSVTLHTGLLVDATVRAIVEKTDGTRLQVDYGKNETALVELWRVHAVSTFRSIFVR